MPETGVPQIRDRTGEWGWGGFSPHFIVKRKNNENIERKRRKNSIKKQKITAKYFISERLNLISDKNRFFMTSTLRLSG